MRKEFIICIIIIVIIFVGNFFSKQYTKNSGEKIIEKLYNLKDKAESENAEECMELINEIEEEWDGKQKKLSYYIEHNELEKIDNNLVSLRSYLEIQEYDDSIREINESIFSIKHIEEKYLFNLKNIF